MGLVTESYPESEFSLHDSASVLWSDKLQR